MSDNTLFEQSVSRRELLKKVAVYTPPVVFGGSALITAGSAFAAKSAAEGSTSVGSTSSEACAPNGSSSSSVSERLPATSPFSALQADLATLVAIPATGVRSVDRKVAEAVGDLTEATISAQWDDEYVLDPAAGDNVFFDLKWAADALSTSGSSSTDVADVISDIVTQAGTLANLAVTAACLTGKPAKKAARKLQKGAQRTAAGNVRGAIGAYMHAWDIAVLGVEAADSDDSDSDD
ncbi:MAG TPA: hypothetical protein VG652_09510 [Gaiellaceae bacterium]|nr:hypothetical protein [Gaiellaceae bacterium]